MSKNIAVYKSNKMSEGQGAKVLRSFPTREISKISPFILMDEFFVEPPASFPLHSHNGFEAITFMLDGAFEHKDNVGNSGKIEKYEAQLMVTGKGIKHSEAPGTEGMNHGLQLWIDLPKKYKNIDPGYTKSDTDDIVVEEKDGVKTHTIIDNNSKIQPHTPVKYQYIELDGASKLTKDIPTDFNAFVYVISGIAIIDDREIKGGNIVKIEQNKININSNDELTFAFASGKPINNS